MQVEAGSAKEVGTMIEEAADMVLTEMTAKIGRQVTGGQDRHHRQGRVLQLHVVPYWSQLSAFCNLDPCHNLNYIIQIGIMIVIEAMTEVVAIEEEATEMALEDLIDMSRQEIVAALTEVTKSSY